jgi:LEA14-like dessication related protein
VFVIFIATNKFICSPSGLAPKFKEIKKSKIVKFNSDSIWIEITANAENRNNFKIEIENLNVNVMQENLSLGNANRNEKWQIEAKETGEIQIHTALDTKKILKIISDEPDSLQLKLIGTADADLGLITLPVNIDIDFTIPVKEQLAKTIQEDTENDKIIKISSAGLKNLNLGGSTVEIGFQIQNPYGIEFSVEGYPSTLFVGNKNLGEGDINEEIVVRKKGEVSKGKITYNLSNTKTLTSLFGSFFSGKLEYETKGNLILNILGYDIKISYTKKGVLAKL